MKKPELLLPANNLEVLKTAVRYGADAVYIGGEAFSLRAKAKNFSLRDMAEGVAFAHAARTAARPNGVRVYVAANVIAHNAELKEARDYFRELKGIAPDALIISDPGMFTLARDVCPEIDVHISTQANNTNYETFLFWHRLGAKRVVCARELTLAEIREIRAHIPDALEIECFVHGSMCVSYSGRCLLSAYMTGRDANRGACAHPCRYRYAVVEETRPGEYMPVYENEKGTFLFNSKDLCMLGHIPELLEAGVNSLKIEGRMKNALYVATIARAYRLAVDDVCREDGKISHAAYEKNLPQYMEEIGKCTYRAYTTGFYCKEEGERVDAQMQIYDNASYAGDAAYLGTIEEVVRTDKVPESGCVAVSKDRKQRETDERTEARAKQGAENRDERTLYKFSQRNKFLVGDAVEIMKPDGSNLRARVAGLYDEAFSPIESCPHPKRTVYMELAGIEERAIRERGKTDALPEAGDVFRG